MEDLRALLEQSNAHQIQILKRLDDMDTRMRVFERQFLRPATREVLDTTELLEAVLLHLPTRDILFAQRISRRFKQVIDGSLRLQRAIFFLPDSLDGHPRLNDLVFNKHNKLDLRMLQPLCHYNSYPGIPEFLLKDGPRCESKPNHEIYMLRVRDWALEGGGDGKAIESAVITFTYAVREECWRWRRLTKYAALDESKNDSWRRMYLCQSCPSVCWRAVSRNGRDKLSGSMDGKQTLGELVGDTEALDPTQ